MICEKINIWNSGEYHGADPDFQPTLTTYVLDGEKIRGGVLILPGGGYALTSQREAECIALRFNAAGYHAFVLYYSVAPNRHPQPLLDASKAMTLIRSKAKKWHLHPQKIAIAGFSAGGHLACSLGVHFNKPYLNHPKMNLGDNRPNAMILSYPVISSGEYRHQGSFINLLGEDAPADLLEEMSLEKQVTSDTPQAFIWHTLEDKGVPAENSILLALALRQYSVPFELHLYPEGKHGLSLVNSEVCPPEDVNPHTGTWITLCLEWLDGIFNAH